MNYSTFHGKTGTFRTGFRIVAAFAAAAMFSMVGANKASAHAMGIGYTAGVNVGEVNLWLGSWHDNGLGDGNDIEGSANLLGIDVVYNTTTAFTYGSPNVNPGGTYTNNAPIPTGLVEGINLFWAPGEGAFDVYSWEAVTITGLIAGTYQFTYVPIANPTLHWTPAAGLQGINLTLTEGYVGGGGGGLPGVPDGGSTAILLGLSLLGFGAVHRKLC